MLSINAVKGFEYGSGFSGTKITGSEHNDLFNEDGTTKLITRVGFKVAYLMEWIFILMLHLNL